MSAAGTGRSPGLVNSLREAVGWIIVLWIIELVDVAVRLSFAWNLDRFGVHPRTSYGLIGIVAAPFLHGSWAHLGANSVSLLILGTLSLWYSRRLTYAAIIAATVVGGLCAWIFGQPDSVHIGASGVIFGLIALLVANGIFRRSFAAIILALVVGVVYGSAIFATIPSAELAKAGISWQMHIGGLIGGILVSYQRRRTAA